MGSAHIRKLSELKPIAFAVIATAFAGCGGGGGGSNTAQAPNPPAQTGGSRTGSATVAWTAPTQNTDGSAITDLAGFRVRYGLSTGMLDKTVEVANPSARSTEVTDLASGTWYFTVTAYSSAGGESDESTAASKTIP